MTLLKEQLGLLAIKNREEIYLYMKLGDADKVNSFRDKMESAVRPRLNYPKVHLLNKNKNN